MLRGAGGVALLALLLPARKTRCVTPYQVERQHLLPTHRVPVVVKTPLLIALGVYLAGGRFDSPAVGLTMVFASALWAILYAINEATDLQQEKGLPVQHRALVWLTLLCCSLCFGAFFVSSLLAPLLMAMTVGQLVYCVPPVRLKRYWWVALLLSGTLNPACRLLCGAIWGTHAIPPLAYATFLSLHLGAAIRSRLLLRERDRKLGYHVAPPHLEWLGWGATLIGLACAYVLCLQGVFPRLFLLFCALATAFALYAWFGNPTNIARLRKAWISFAFLALIAVALLWLQK